MPAVGASKRRRPGHAFADPALRRIILGKEWRTWEERRGGPLRLSPVLPIVFHTGSQPWSTHEAFADLFEAPAALLGHLPGWRPLFFDLASESTEELLKAAGAWRNALAVVRGEKDAAANYKRLFTDVLARLAALRESDPMRWHDLMWFVLSWGWRRRSRAEGQSLLAAATAAFERNIPIHKEVEAMSQQLQKTWEDEVSEETSLRDFREAIQANLEERFGKAPPDVLSKIGVIDDLGRLKSLHRQSARIQSLDELSL